MANDLAFNIVALDRASETFIRLASQVDRLSDRLDRLDRKDVTAKVTIKTDESMRSLDSFTTRFALMSTAITVASPLIGAALIGGIGAGFVGIAGLAQKSNQDVQATYSTLWANVKATTQNATVQLVPQIVGAGRAIDAQLQKLAPDVQQAFSFAGPAIVALSRGVTDFASNAMPGATAAMQNGLPVAEGFASLMGQLGTTFANTATSISQHSAEFGTDLQSAGGIANSVLGAATDVVNTLGVAWARNAPDINSAVDGVTGSVSGLARGALPALDASLDVTATLLGGVGAIIQPLSPLLGTVGVGALATWGAFKLAGVATVGVRSLASGVVSLGASMEANAAKSATMIAGLRGVDVAASTTARAVTAAGAASATAAVRVGAAAESLAGPLGIALVGATFLLGAFASRGDQAAQTAQQLAGATDALTSAYESSHGAVDKQVISALQAQDAFKQLTADTQDGAFSQQDLIDAVTKGGAALDVLKDKLRAAFDNADDPEEKAGVLKRITNLALLVDANTKGKKGAEDNATAQARVTQALTGTVGFQQSAAAAARTLGVNLGTVTQGFTQVANAASTQSMPEIAASYLNSALTIASAGQQITDHFAALDRAVAQAQRGVADASRSYQQSARQIGDAQHSLANAQRAVRDAYANVTAAEDTYTQAQQRERDAQNAVNAARRQAVEDLKALHEQLDDQVTSEQSARVRLFESTQAGSKFGVTGDNARDLAAQQVTAENLEQVKAALDVVSAQDALNDVLDTGAKLRRDVSAADAVGVEGSQGVVAAQQAVKSAHGEVISAKRALERAQEQVTEAAYAEQRAHQQVTDAVDQNRRSAEQLTAAERALADAQSAAGRGFDISTRAGQENLSLLMRLWKAIGDTGVPEQDRIRQMVEQTATAFGISRQAAADYLTQLGLIPRDYRINVTVTWYELSNGDIASSSGGRFIRGMADGGRVVGLGGPRDDANLIWASAGEFMQPADSVAHYGLDVMEAMRTKRLRIVGGDGGMGLRRYADGGWLAPGRSGSRVEPVMLHGGQGRASATSPTVKVSVASGRTPAERMLLGILRDLIQVEYGGDVQRALGS